MMMSIYLLCQCMHVICFYHNILHNHGRVATFMDTTSTILINTTTMFFPASVLRKHLGCSHSIFVNTLVLSSLHITMQLTQGSIDLFRGACAVKGNVQVAGHVKRIDQGAVLYA